MKNSIQFLESMEFHKNGPTSQSLIFVPEARETLLSPSNSIAFLYWDVQSGRFSNLSS